MTIFSNTSLLSIILKNAFVFLLLILCSSHSQSKELVNKILVNVNTEIVLQSDLKKLQERLNKNGAIDESLLLGENKETLLNNPTSQIDFLIREKLVESEIKRLNYAVTDDRVEAELVQMSKKAQMSRSEFGKYLLKQGFQIEEYKEILKTRIERQSFFENEIVSKLRITDEDAYSEFQIKNPNYRPNVNEFTIAQIFFNPKKGGAEAALQRANLAIQKINNESFESVANAVNETPDANKDGYLGTFKSGEFISEIEKAIGSLAANQVSAVIKSHAGYHIVKVISKKTTLDPNFLKVKDMIKSSLIEKNFQRQLKNWFETKKQDAYILKQEKSI